LLPFQVSSSVSILGETHQKRKRKKSTSKTKEPRIPNKQMLTKEKKPPATMPVVGLCEFYFVMELGTSLFFLLCQK
jgi:hypothetical protein